mmetsp:Transcript_18033/g.44876  ORF Transcript_18033/g.44876 Transcript_18033/m.44876 type:complete len:273 (+) Transcript_18033:1535-2353(+)
MSFRKFHQTFTSCITRFSFVSDSPKQSQSSEMPQAFRFLEESANSNAHLFWFTRFSFARIFLFAFHLLTLSQLCLGGHFYYCVGYRFRVGGFGKINDGNIILVANLGGSDGSKELLLFCDGFIVIVVPVALKFPHSGHHHRFSGRIVGHGSIVLVAGFCGFHRLPIDRSSLGLGCADSFIYSVAYCLIDGTTERYWWCLVDFSVFDTVGNIVLTHRLDLLVVVVVIVPFVFSAFQDLQFHLQFHYAAVHEGKQIDGLVVNTVVCILGFFLHG